MTNKISFEVTASDASIKPDDYRNIRVEVDGIAISDLLESIEDNASILEEIGEEKIADWISEENKLAELLNHFDDVDLADYLKNKGWVFAEAVNA
ncbi:hypothetical protein [Buttiauxella sp. S19-1]|uniref:hypothetical protein n=1 Tax=Buttiauxella sp. S19-1 TaxID=941430 RepID=UPI001EDC7B12|nr:hypothetical protein [Buttiauxella sp. S19-1]